MATKSYQMAQVELDVHQDTCCLHLAFACDHALAEDSPVCQCQPCLACLVFEVLAFETFFACLHDQLGRSYCEQAHHFFELAKHLHCWSPSCVHIAPACFVHSTAHRVDIEILHSAGLGKLQDQSANTAFWCTKNMHKQVYCHQAQKLSTTVLKSHVRPETLGQRLIQQRLTKHAVASLGCEAASFDSILVCQLPQTFLARLVLACFSVSVPAPTCSDHIRAASKGPKGSCLNSIPLVPVTLYAVFQTMQLPPLHLLGAKYRHK